MEHTVKATFTIEGRILNEIETIRQEYNWDLKEALNGIIAYAIEMHSEADIDGVETLGGLELTRVEKTAFKPDQLVGIVRGTDGRVVYGHVRALDHTLLTVELTKTSAAREGLLSPVITVFVTEVFEL